MDLIGIPAVRIGSTVSIPQGGFNVSEDCSGFAGIYASFPVALVLGTYNRSRVRIGMMIAAPWLLAVAVNVPRGIVLLLGVKYLGIPFLATLWHTASRIVAFWLASLPMFLVADLRTFRAEIG